MTFKDQIAWIKGVELSVLVHHETADFPTDENLDCDPKCEEQPILFHPIMPKDMAGRARRVNGLFTGTADSN